MLTSVQSPNLSLEAVVNSRFTFALDFLLICVCVDIHILPSMHIQLEQDCTVEWWNL